MKDPHAEITNAIKQLRPGESLVDLLGRRAQAAIDARARRAWERLWRFGEKPKGQETLDKWLNYDGHE